MKTMAVVIGMAAGLLAARVSSSANEQGLMNGPPPPCDCNLDGCCTENLCMTPDPDCEPT
jgi:hypothetical protein